MFRPPTRAFPSLGIHPSVLSTCLTFPSRDRSTAGLRRGAGCAWDGNGELGDWGRTEGALFAVPPVENFGASRLIVLGFPRGRRSFLFCLLPALPCEGRRRLSVCDPNKNDASMTTNGLRTTRIIMRMIVSDSPVILPTYPFLLLNIQMYFQLPGFRDSSPYPLQSALSMMTRRSMAYLARPARYPSPLFVISASLRSMSATKVPSASIRPRSATVSARHAPHPPFSTGSQSGVTDSRHWPDDSRKKCQLHRGHYAPAMALPAIFFFSLFFFMSPGIPPVNFRFRCLGALPPDGIP